MFIDAFFIGVRVEEVLPVAVYSDGKKTDEQERNSGGVPLWHIVSAMKSGAYILPCRVKVATYQPPKKGEMVKFIGVQAFAWGQNNIAWTAEKIEKISAENNQELEDIFAEEGEK